MEEDVRDLKELLDVFYKEKDTTWITIHTPQIKNIENILNELDRLQKENEKLKEEIMENDLKVIGAEEYTKASMGEIIENYYTANEDCIPKSVIQDKIEEIINNSTFGCVGCEWNDIEVVQLLENILRGNK